MWRRGAILWSILEFDLNLTKIFSSLCFYLTPQTFGVQQYLFDALQCGEVVWHFGLLKKGYGLCHGAAGNAYTFLALYRQTQDPKHLYRACVVRERERGSVMLKRNSWRLGYRTPGRVSVARLS